MSNLICFETVYISYQQMTQMGKDNEDNEPMADDKSFQDDQYIK